MRNSRSCRSSCNGERNPSSCHWPWRRTDAWSTRSAGEAATASAASVSTRVMLPSAPAAASTPRALNASARSRYSWLLPSPCTPKRRRVRLRGSQRYSPREVATQTRCRASTRIAEAATAGIPAAMPTRVPGCQRPSSRRYSCSPDTRCSHNMSLPSKASAYTRSAPISRSVRKRRFSRSSRATPSLPPTHTSPLVDSTRLSMSTVPSPPASPAGMSSSSLPLAVSRCCTPPPGADSHRLRSAPTSNCSMLPPGTGSSASSARHSSIAPSTPMRSRPVRWPSQRRPAPSSAIATSLTFCRRSRLSASRRCTVPSTSRRSTVPL